MERALESLTGLSHKLAEQMYRTTGDGQAAAAGSAREEDDEVIDAEYVDVDEKAS